MAHIRQQIRDGMAAALAGNVPAVGANIFAGRVYPLQDAELPGVLVGWTSESSDPITFGSLLTVERHLTLTVKCIAKALGAVQDVVDNIGLQVEAALSTPCAGVSAGGLPAKSLDYISATFRETGTIELPTGELTMIYTAKYMCTESAPDIAL